MTIEIGDRVAYLSSPTSHRSSAYCGTVVGFTPDGLARVATEGYGRGCESHVPVRALRHVPADMSVGEVWSRGEQLFTGR